MTENDLAIILTRKIEGEIVMLCSNITKLDEKSVRAAPNFYMIRESILKTLVKYISILRVSTSSSPEVERHYSDEILKDIKKYEIKKEATALVEKILEDGEQFISKIEYKDEFDRYRTVTKQIMLLKLGLIEEDVKQPATT